MTSDKVKAKVLVTELFKCSSPSRTCGWLPVMVPTAHMITDNHTLLLIHQASPGRIRLPNIWGPTQRMPLQMISITFFILKVCWLRVVALVMIPHGQAQSPVVVAPWRSGYQSTLILQNTAHSSCHAMMGLPGMTLTVGGYTHILTLSNDK